MLDQLLVETFKFGRLDLVYSLRDLKNINHEVEKQFKRIYDISKNCNINSISDIGVAAEMLNACAKGAIYNIKINIKELNKNKKIYFNNKIDYYSKINDDYYLKIVNIVYKNI